MQHIRHFRLPVLISWLLLVGNTFLFPLYPAGDFDPVNSMTEALLEGILELDDTTPGDEHKDEGADPLKRCPELLTTGTASHIRWHIPPVPNQRIADNTLSFYSTPPGERPVPPPDRLS